ncbi:hypothetical protein D3C86_1993870 [compost metagenome]
MAWLQHAHGFVDQKIVAWAGFDRQGGAHQLSAAVVTSKAASADVATQVVADVRRHHVGEGFQHFGIG